MLLGVIKPQNLSGTFARRSSSPAFYSRIPQHAWEKCRLGDSTRKSNRFYMHQMSVWRGIYGELKERWARSPLNDESWGQLRSWGDFFAVLKPPQANLKHLEQRIVANALHYKVNYVALTAIIFSLEVLFHPFLLLALCAVLAFSCYTCIVMKKPIVLGGIIINETGVKIGTVTISVLFLAIIRQLEQLLWGAIVSLVVCLAHMLLRPRSVTSSRINLPMQGVGGAFSIGWGGGTNSQVNANDLESQQMSPPSGVIFPKHE